MSDLLVRDIEHIIPHSFEYQDEALEIEVTVSERMGALRSAEFERVLHKNNSYTSNLLRASINKLKGFYLERKILDFPLR